MKRKLPREISVGKTKYRVVRKYARLSQIGKISYPDKTIAVATQDRYGNLLTFSEQTEIFWHELTHGILHDMDHPLRDNEKFVTAFARRLSGAVESAKF